MRRLFFMVFSFLLVLTILRVFVFSSNPLSFSSFLQICSTVDIDFSNVLSLVPSHFAHASSMIGSSFLETLSGILEIIGTVLVAPFSVIIDLVDFLSSVLALFYKLLGVPSF